MLDTGADIQDQGGRHTASFRRESGVLPGDADAAGKGAHLRAKASDGKTSDDLASVPGQEQAAVVLQARLSGDMDRS